MKNLIKKDPIARMKGKFLAFLFVSLLLSTSCSKDDTPANPVGTATFKMMNEGNGRTELGTSDVYITNSNNFYGTSYILSSLGKVDGLNSISEMLLLDGTNTAAVEQGNAYQVFFRHDVREFPSGKLAINIASSYYNVYVVSKIKQNNAIVGANVKFALTRVADKDLPAYRQHFIKGSDPNTWTIVAELPTSDFEYEMIKSEIIIDWIGEPTHKKEEDLNKFECKKEGNKLIFSFDYKKFNPYHSAYVVLIRVDNVFTAIQFEVEE